MQGVSTSGLKSTRATRKRKRNFDNDWVNDVSDSEKTDEADPEIRKAVINSRIDSSAELPPLPACKTYYPTLEEFSDPSGFIKSIQSEAEQFGIVKICPPKEWKMPFSVDMDSTKRFKTTVQRINLLCQGVDYDNGDSYTPKEYKAAAEKFFDDWMKLRNYDNCDPHNLEFQKSIEHDYWSLVNHPISDDDEEIDDVLVEYGNDIDTSVYWSGFPNKLVHEEENDGDDNKGYRYRRKHKNDLNPTPTIDLKNCEMSVLWNLNLFCQYPSSILKCLSAHINGVNVPWLYFGSLFCSFCWHVEDNFLYSINYLGSGSPKQWYSCPASSSNKFAMLVKSQYPDLFETSPSLLLTLTCQFSPHKLLNLGLDVFSIIQQPGEFIITFPRAYHAGFSYGSNIGEAVNFALMDWIPYAIESAEEYRQFARSSVFSIERLVMTLAYRFMADDNVDVTDDLKDGDVSCLKHHLEFIFQRCMQERRLMTSADFINETVVQFPLLLDEHVTAIHQFHADYDDVRSCQFCKSICFFHAVLCHCSPTKVSCLMHAKNHCNLIRDGVPCSYMVQWGSEMEFRLFLDRFYRAVKAKGLN